MNVFTAIMMFMAVVAALILAVGVCLIGVGVIAAVYCCITDDPKNRLVIGLDYGKRMNDAVERIVTATERCVDLTAESVGILSKEYEDDEDSDYIELM